MSVLVFDGDCAFCTRSAGFITRRIRPRTEVRSSQSLDLSALGLTPEQCALAVQWVGDDASIRSGAAAITSMLREGGRGWALLGTVGQLPGIRSAAELGYRVVASNRHRMPGGCAACEMTD